MERSALDLEDVMTVPSEPAPIQTDNSVRPEDGEQDVDQEPNLVDEK